MLFEGRSLRSIYDFGMLLPEEDANLTSLSKEIWRITQLLYTAWKAGEKTAFRHRDNQGQLLYVDAFHVSESTWNRSEGEIKELLYRRDKNGREQKQFSIAKALSLFHIQTGQEALACDSYYQLLYFFYMMNYFAFPRKNIFLFLRFSNAGYRYSYDEGNEQGKYVTFILSNLFDDQEVFDVFCRSTTLSGALMNQLSQDVISLCSHGCTMEEICRCVDLNLSRPELIYNDFLLKVMRYCHCFSMYGYVCDLYENLNSHQELFLFPPIKIQPFEEWKALYIDVEELDTFLYTSELYCFCRQTIRKVEVRDKIKFNAGNAVKFLKQLIAFDRQWMELFDEQEGVLLQTIDGRKYIYALRAAVVIKTYIDLTKILKVKLKSGRKELDALRFVLSCDWSFHSVLPPTLAVRFFLLAAHGEYINVISRNPKEDQKAFLKNSIDPEKTVMRLLMRVFSQENTDVWVEVLQQSMEIVSVMKDIKSQMEIG